jgi:hypothetical protein
LYPKSTKTVLKIRVELIHFQARHVTHYGQKCV